MNTNELRKAATAVFADKLVTLRKERVKSVINLCVDYCLDKVTIDLFITSLRVFADSMEEEWRDAEFGDDE